MEESHWGSVFSKTAWPPGGMRVAVNAVSRVGGFLRSFPTFSEETCIAGPLIMESLFESEWENCCARSRHFPHTWR